MQQVDRKHLEFFIRHLVTNYEEFVTFAPGEAQMLAQLGNVPLDQVFLITFHNDLAEARRNAKLTWPRSEGWLKFEENKSELFAHEEYKPVSYTTSTDLGYVTRPASECYNHLFWMIYHELGGDNDYKTPQELVEKFQRLISGLNILELGCGPGFALWILQNHGALCKGIDIRDLAIPEIFRPETGNARQLSRYYKAEEFDLIISHDFFCEVVVSQEDSAQVLSEAHHVLRPGGCMISEINFFRMDAPIYLVINYLILKKQGVMRDIDDYIHILFDSGETLAPIWNNKLSIRIDDCIAAGFGISAIVPEAEYLTVVLKKS